MISLSVFLQFILKHQYAQGCFENMHKKYVFCLYIDYLITNIMGKKSSWNLIKKFSPSHCSSNSVVLEGPQVSKTKSFISFLDSKINLVQNSWTILVSQYLHWSQILWSIIILLYCEWNVSFSKTEVLILRLNFEEEPDNLNAKKKEKNMKKENCKAVGRNLVFCSVLGPAVSKIEDCRTPFCGSMGQGANLCLFIQCCCCSSVNVGLVLYTTSANALTTIEVGSNK